MINIDLKCFVTGSEVIYQFEKDAGDPDYVRLWDRMQEKPEDAIFSDVGTGLEMIKEDRLLQPSNNRKKTFYYYTKLILEVSCMCSEAPCRATSGTTRFTTRSCTFSATRGHFTWQIPLYFNFITGLFFMIFIRKIVGKS